MTDRALLIKNARIVNEGCTIDGDVLIRAGRIERIGSGLAADSADEILDAAGLHLLPGLIDDQVHFREPGLTAKGDMATESAAAVAGGITSFMEMPNVRPPTTDLGALADKYSRAAGRSRANFAFYLGATNDNIEEIRRLKPADACGVKMFMGASTGNMLVNDPHALDQIFADSPLLIATHCEDSPMIAVNEQAMREKYGEDVPLAEHPAIRSEAACYASSSLAVELAQKHDARLHVLHLTTNRELDLFTPGPVDGKRITAEVCVHHLFFDESRYADLGAQIKCNPAIKTAADREALLEGLATGRIDVVATDHAPHLAEEKIGTYFNVPAGLPLVQHALLSLLEHVHDRRFSLELVVARSSHAVAELFGIAERGYIREGYCADLVLVDLGGETLVSPDNLLYKCGWSPFDGYRFRSSIAATIVNGVIACRDGVLTEAIAGQRLDCNSAR